MTGWTSDELAKIGTAQERRSRPCAATAACATPGPSGSSAWATTSMSDPYTGAPAAGSPAPKYATAMIPAVVAVGSDSVRHRRDAWLWTCRPAVATVFVPRAVVVRV
jgi:hypothetical protein